LGGCFPLYANITLNDFEAVYDEFLDVCQGYIVVKIVLGKIGCEEEE